MSMVEEKDKTEEKQISRVFVVEAVQNVPISSAEEFGKIVPLFESAEIPNNRNIEGRSKPYSTRPSIWTEDENGSPTLIKDIIYKLEIFNYNPEKDYLLVAGHMIPTVILVTAAVIEYEKVRVLFWSPDWKQYVVRTI